MINYFEPYFKLDTDHTTYCFKVLETGHLEHLHYGDYLFGESAADLNPLSRQRAFGVGNSIAYDEDHQELTLENVCLEFGTKGKGDLREPLIDVTCADGSTTRDFHYVSHTIDDKEPDLKGMPGSYGACEHLCITLKDQNSELILNLHYHVYEHYDVITRYSELINQGEEEVIINRLLSNQIDFDQSGLVLTTFNGAWAREMMRYDHHVTSGAHVNQSTTGTSSSRANPFVMISRTETNDHIGRCYGFNLIYSGNHYESLSVNAFDQSRFVQGINPDYFAYHLEAGETFMSPEAIMSYDNHGFNDLSSHFHAFINDCIVRGSYKHKERPILLNSWEAAYFNIDERRLLRLARKAKDAGIELFVMDDGWFGERNDDTSSLGDWYVNEKKLPKGLEGIASKINDMGMEFGLWVEPEMVNPDSHLYREHPEWVLGHPEHKQSLGRHQCILDLCNPEVVDYLFKTMSHVFSSANITYVKWDMNRNISDYYSQYLDDRHQSEVSHRYVLGLYQLMERLTTAFPYILFEGCASGGNRFDLGILSYFPQIWASDDTDAVYRLEAQQNYSYGYPLSTISAHVSSSPNHQTLRATPLTSRFAVACFGVLGYELQLNDLTVEEFNEVKEQIALYKRYRHLFQFGRFYRRIQPLYNWTVVDQDRQQAVGMIMQTLNKANYPDHRYFANGLNPKQRYHIVNRTLKYNIKSMGDLINTASPIHVRQGSLTHEVISRVVKLDGELDDFITTGSILMHHGIKIKPAFGGTGFNDETRLFTDFASRMYMIEAVDDSND